MRLGGWEAKILGSEEVRKLGCWEAMYGIRSMEKS